MNQGGPYIEFNFYFNEDTNENNYKKVIEALLLTNKRKYKVVYLPLSSKSEKINNKPIAIWQDGSIFSMDETDNKVYQKGKEVYVFFKKIVKILQPSYANITIDYGLQTPYDIIKDINTSSIPFENFYLSHNYIKELNSFIDEIKELGAYTENFEEIGFYYSTNPLFNPKKTYISSNSLNLIKTKIFNIFLSINKSD